jgi:hypothetical protein
MQVVTGCMKVITFVSLGLLVAMILLKEAIPGKDGRFILNRSLHRFHIIFGVSLLVLVDVFGGLWLKSLLQSIKAKRVWSHRRRRATQKAAARGLAVNVILVSYIVMNSVVLGDSENFCKTSPVLKIAETLQWQGWNVLLLIMLIDAHEVNLHETPDKPDGLVLDLPWKVHWPKLFISIPLFGVILHSHDAL